MKTAIIFFIIGMVGIFAMLLAPTLNAVPADARITPGGCSNGNNLPPGQQPTCKGGGLTQQPNTNPSGHQERL
jgi:hypothetical protein